MEEFIDEIRSFSEVVTRRLWYVDPRVLQQAAKNYENKLKEKIALAFVEEHNARWKDAEHCTCLAAAISAIFDEKYDKQLV